MLYAGSMLGKMHLGVKYQESSGVAGGVVLGPGFRPWLKASVDLCKSEGFMGEGGVATESPYTVSFESDFKGV